MKENRILLELEQGAMNPVVLIEEDETFTLVDAGLPHHAPQILALFEAQGLKAENLTKLILTHQDLDHMGGAKEIVAACKNAKVYAHETEAPYIDGSKAAAKQAAKLATGNCTEKEKAELEASIENYKNYTLQIDTLLKEGQRIEGKTKIEVVFTPGHTPGHICLYLPDEKTLITGDALNAREKGALSGPNPEYTLDMDMAMQSLKKLQAYEIETLLCYHGGKIEKDVSAQIEKLVENYFA